MNQIPPFDLEAEAAVLSSCLIRGSLAVDEIADVLDHKMFYRDQHRFIFEAAVTLTAASEPVDLVTVGSWLRENGHMDRIGGAGHLIEIANSSPSVTTESLRAYANTVREKAILRTLLESCQRAVAEIYLGVPDLDPFVHELENRLQEATIARRMAGIQSFREIMRNSFKEVMARQKMGPRMAGLSTGLMDLDVQLGGMHATDLTVIAARPGMGKTSLALGIALSVARQDHGVIVFSLEMPASQLGNRAMCLEAQVNLQGMRTGNYHAGEWSRITSACGTLGPLPIFIDDTGDIPLQTMRTIVRRKQAELARDGKKLGLVVIDYIQLMSGTAGKGATRDEHVSGITRGLKAMAKEANVAVMALSQLNRGVESRADKRPMLSDLRESGAIEQDADNVIFVYRDDYYNAKSSTPNVAELNIAKQRNGPIGTTKVHFDPQYTRFGNLAYDEAAE